LWFLEGPQLHKRDQTPVPGLSDRLGIGDPWPMFERMFMHSPVPHLIFTADGSLVACNPAYRDVFGHEPAPGFNVLGDEPSDSPELADAVRRAVAGEVVRIGPIWRQRPLSQTGQNTVQRLAVEYSVFPLVENAAGVTHIAVACRDVTAETDTVAARLHSDALAESLRASERQLRLITDSLPALVTYMGQDRRFRFTNNAYKAWFGIEPHSLIGKHARELVGEVGYRQIQPYMERALAGETVHYERDVTLPDGRTIYTQMSYVPDKDDEGRTLGYVALIHDMTDRRRAELELQAERQRLHDILMNAPAAISLRSGPEHVFRFVNAAYQRMLPGRDILGRTTREVHAVSTTPRFLELLKRVYATGEAVTGLEVPAQIPSPDGNDERFLNITYQPLRDADGRIDSVISFAVDVTEQVTARRRAEQLSEALLESEARYRGFVNQSTEGIWRIEMGEPVATNAPVDEQLAGVLWHGAAGGMQRRDGADVRIRARRPARRPAAARAVRPRRPAQRGVPARVHRQRLSVGGGRVSPRRQRRPRARVSKQPGGRGRGRPVVACVGHATGRDRGSRCS
jgi:PAS domain S-box-containing protein